jgi:hypothetical protein
MSSTVSAAPDRWRFEVYTEGHNYLMRDLKNEGDWAVGAYVETNNPTLLKLVIVCKGGEEYYLKVKAEHNVCPFESDNRYTEQLWLMVGNFWDHYKDLVYDNRIGFVPLSGIFGTDWDDARTRKDAKSSCSVMRSANRFKEDGTLQIRHNYVSTENFDVAAEWLLDAIDSVEEYGWFSE